MSDVFGAPAEEEPSGPCSIFILTATFGLCALAGIAWAVAAFLHEGGFRICPDGGDEIWSRPSIGSYASEAVVGVVAVGLLVAVLRAAVATRWAAALSVASAGSLVGYLTIDEYVANAGLPDHYRCGTGYPGAGMPGYVAPALVLVYLLVFTSWRAGGRASG